MQSKEGEQINNIAIYDKISNSPIKFYKSKVTKEKNTLKVC